MYLDVSRTGNIHIFHPDLQPWEMPKEQSCALDIIEGLGPMTLQEVGDFLNMTRERVRQIEETIFFRLSQTRLARTLREALR
jgi:hypothetical protein